MTFGYWLMVARDAIANLNECESNPNRVWLLLDAASRGDPLAGDALERAHKDSVAHLNAVHLVKRPGGSVGRQAEAAAEHPNGYRSQEPGLPELAARS